MQRLNETVDYEIMADCPYLTITLTYVNFQTIIHEYIIILDLLDHSIVSIEFIMNYSSAYVFSQ